MGKELGVIYEARVLSKYIFVITDKSPKKYRFTLVGKLQNYSLEVIESLLFANMTFVEQKDKAMYQKRYQYQKQALANLKLLSYMAELAKEVNCILTKQYEQISKQVYACQNQLIAWIKSDKQRLQ